MTSTPHSNAFNFFSYLKHQVDPRTGQYTATISIPDINANRLCGPTLPLTLSFNPLSSLNHGFGPGWSWQLSQYDTGTNILILSTGETFKVDRWDITKAIFDEQKLITFNFYRESSDAYRIVHKSGLTEILELQSTRAMPVRQYSPQGHDLSLTYESWANASGLVDVLNCVYDAQKRVLFKVSDIGSTTLKIELYPEFVDYNSTFLWTSVPDSLKTIITLPTDDKAKWLFTYSRIRDYLCITQVYTPNGASERIEYADEGHGHPGNANLRLPRVTSHIISPGSEQPTIITNYSYVLKDVLKKHNFLGYQAAGMVWTDDGSDNLYQVSEDYKYGSIQTIMAGVNAGLTIERTYNRFHLLIREFSRQNDNISVVNTSYNLLPDRLFSEQPRNFQTPILIKKLWYLQSDTSMVREESETLEFDMHGNMTLRILADGSSQSCTYYSADGEGRPGDDFYCPAHPEDFVQSLKTKKLIPAPSQYGDAPVLEFQYCYGPLKSLHPEIPDSLVQITEKRFHATAQPDKGERRADTPVLLQRIDLIYYDNPEDWVTHGRIKRQTTYINQHVSLLDFAYQETNDEQGLQYLETRQTMINNVDKTSRSNIVRVSYISGQTVYICDESGTEATYTFDNLGRIVAESIAPDTANSATRVYKYALAVVEGLTKEVTITDVQGVQTRIMYDGLDRVFYKERQDTDSASRANAFRQTYAARYDARGNLIVETNFDWTDDSNSLKLTHHFIYDDWNQLICTIGPDGVQHYEITDPIGLKNTEGVRERTVTQWTQSRTKRIFKQGLTRTRLSAMEKPLRIEQLDTDNNIISLYEYRYDGAGNCVTEIDQKGFQTHYTYDALNRLTSQLHPDLTRVGHTYSAHSNEALFEKIEVKSSGIPSTVLGSQVFDGLGRVTQLNVGRRSERRSYTGSLPYVSQRTTLKNVPITYKYDFNLTDSPILIKADDEATFTYDKITSQLKDSINSQGSREYIYNKLQQLTDEIWNDQSGNVIHTEYISSSMGRQLRRSQTINGILNTDSITTYQYDSQGRVTRMEQGVLEARFSYDLFGRLHTTTTKHIHATKESVLLTTLEYDVMGREIKRSLALNNLPARTIFQTWNIQGLLAIRDLQHDGKCLLKETFYYDSRNRLTEYYCEGSDLPKDEYGQAIRVQIFELDGLDNITESLTIFDDDSQDSSTYTFHPDDPCQLFSVSHSHPRYVEAGRALCEFEFDEDGNQKNDEYGNVLEYDSLSRLQNVKNASSGDLVSSYRYDSHNQLIASTPPAQSESLRMYEGLQLASTLQDNVQTHYFRNTEQALGQQRSDDASQALLFMTDANRSVIAHSQQDTVTTATYSAYGDPGEYPLDSVLGFNGEVREPGSGLYLLGKGYRAYNPSLKRFHSPDSLSPFSIGGLNPYVYCLGNPIRFRDPTGHFSYSQQLDSGNPVYARSSSIAGINWLSGLVIAVGVAITAVVTVATWGAATALSVALIAVAIDIVSTGLSIGAMYNRGQASRNLDLASYASLVPLVPWAATPARRALGEVTRELVHVSIETPELFYKSIDDLIPMPNQSVRIEDAVPFTMPAPIKVSRTLNIPMPNKTTNNPIFVPNILTLNGPELVQQAASTVKITQYSEAQQAATKQASGSWQNSNGKWGQTPNSKVILTEGGVRKTTY